MNTIAEVTLDNISSLGGLEVSIDPKLFLCSLCYCINPNCKQCKNPKCLKLFCNKCYDKSKTVQSICPFCRITLDYRKADNSLYDIISGLRYYCSKSLQCNEHYSLSEYTINHSNVIVAGNNNKKIISNHKEIIVKCNICHYRLDKTPNWLICILCNKKGCSWNIDVIPKEFSSGINNINSCLKKCFICKGAICIRCLEQYTLKKGLNFICEYCSASCFYCYTNEQVNYICDFCQRILCVKCSLPCEMCSYIFCRNRQCYKNQINTCKDCIGKASDLNFYKCLHEIIFECEQCYPKCQRCFRRKSIINCSSCTKPLCGINCGLKCKDCKSINCASCMSMCSICKKITCMQCKKFCWNCSQEPSMISCQECNSDSIRKCQYAQCAKYLCINCWNVCNYCNTIFCNEHSFTCINCEDSMCNEHYNQCLLCSKGNDSDYKKLCLKKCTMKCSFCPNTSNSYCITGNHKENMVSNYNCEHNVCESCVKKCGKCKQIVVTCLKCIVNYYFIHCKYCDVYLCSNCSGHCDKCEDDYCIMEHLCYCCEKIVKLEGCVNCVIKTRNQCEICMKGLDQCLDCMKRYVCSENCYKEYTMNENEKKHLCSMFRCKEHLNYEQKKIKNSNDFCLINDNDGEFNTKNNKEIFISNAMINGKQIKK